MAHRRLLIGMAGLLAVAAGGVFVLVNQEGNKVEIPPETLVAGVDRVVEQQDSEAFEASLQTDRTVAKPEPQPIAKQPTPVPAAPKPLSPFTPAPIPVPFPTPTPTSAPARTTPPIPTPKPTQVSPPVSAPSPAPQPVEKININTAGLEELGQITGVGPAIAQRIIDYRTDVSLFYRIEDIKNVDGIGDVNFEKMRNEIMVGNVTPEPPSSQPPPQTPEPSKININTANPQELDEITGVGPAIAKNIIDYRTEHGSFQGIEDIKNVKGIGDTTFENMKEEITI